jgi:hypothetical protein
LLPSAGPTDTISFCLPYTLTIDAHPGCATGKEAPPTPIPEEAPPTLPDKGEFLANPLGSKLPDNVPTEWLREGWQREKFRDDIIYCLVRSVSKVGDFTLAGDVWLRGLPRALDTRQVVDLYQRIRDESQRLELEWRPAFQLAFGTHELPASQDGDVVVGELRHMIESGSGQAFPDLVEVLVQLAIARDQLDPATPGSLLALAHERGRTAMISILEEARQNLEQRDPS